MQQANAHQPAASEVCLVLEGTYPYVHGGVSSWVHDIVRTIDDTQFSLLHIVPRLGAYGEPRYQMPGNITGLVDSTRNEHIRISAALVTSLPVRASPSSIARSVEPVSSYASRMRESMNTS